MVERPAPPDAAYEEIRRKLLERGYLEGRIERFVLRGALGLAPRLGVARAALKAAFLGGPILGGLLASAAAAANRPLLRPADGLVLWLYFSVLAGAALFLLNCGIALVVASLALRRGARRNDRLSASLLVGVPTLAYLVLVWRGRRPTAGLEADALFLGAALVATLLVAWLAGLVSLAGIVGRAKQVPPRARRLVPTLVLVLLPLTAGALVVLGAIGREPSRPVAAAAFEVSAPAGRLLLIGVDGLDAALVEALEPRGAVSGILERMETGAVFPLAHPAAEPPQVWTTLMTGMPPDVHGVRGARSERVPGVRAALRSDGGPAALDAALRFLLPTSPVPTSGAVRRVRTVWEIAALARPSVAVGWWASWPAGDPGANEDATVVSDRLLAKLLSGGAQDRDTSPESLHGILEGRFESDLAALHSEFDRLFGSLEERARRLAWEPFLIDGYHARVARRLVKETGVEALFVYLPGLDILRARLASESAVETYVRWLDGLLRDGLPEAETSIVVADPGRTAPPGTEGFVIVSARSARKGCVGLPLGEMDVAPLTLALLGFPGSAEMAGRVPTQCLDLASPALLAIPTYGRRALPPGPQESDYDQEMIERLRSLGYVR